MKKEEVTLKKTRGDDLETSIAKDTGWAYNKKKKCRRKDKRVRP